jgi:aminoglycoside phosphotransferase (APT) family kinase protein
MPRPRASHREMIRLVDRTAITPELAAKLVAAQFPHWACLPVRPVDLAGWDNITFRLGQDMSVRLPSGAIYFPQVDKEHRWLPELARQVPLPIPEPVARGVPGCGYPWPWSIYRWLPGRPAAASSIADLGQFAADLADFLAALYRIDPAGGPPGGEHSCFRGGPVAVWDEQTRAAIKVLDGQIDTGRATHVWETALAAGWHGPPVWVHGDVSTANLLTDGGRLSAVIDFGCSAVGDPACDTVIAWTLLTGESRRIFRERLPVDDGTWARGRGWALWKALIILAQEDDPETRHVITEILTDHTDSP